ncbi:MAG: hypothetical protein Q7K28_03465 [Candidatus Wildermuthbacteria bacterium]|nr:hypothetical protein [Candidatus Wildermuthbacteria bacterium]
MFPRFHNGELDTNFVLHSLNKFLNVSANVHFAAVLPTAGREDSILLFLKEQRLEGLKESRHPRRCPRKVFECGKMGVIEGGLAKWTPITPTNSRKVRTFPYGTSERTG